MLRHFKLNDKNHFQRVQITILQRGQLFNLLFITSDTNNSIKFLSSFSGCSASNQQGFIFTRLLQAKNCVKAFQLLV